MPQASEPAQQQVSRTRDRLHGQQQSHDQIAADVQASCLHGMTNQRLQGCGAQQQGGEQQAHPEMGLPEQGAPGNIAEPFHGGLQPQQK